MPYLYFVDGKKHYSHTHYARLPWHWKKRKKKLPIFQIHSFSKMKRSFDAFVSKCIDDADILSGWSEANTIFHIWSIALKFFSIKIMLWQFSLWNIFPRDVYIKNSRKCTYETMGRCHLDYLELYKKHNQQ